MVYAEVGSYLCCIFVTLCCGIVRKTAEIFDMIEVIKNMDYVSTAKEAL